MKQTTNQKKCKECGVIFTPSYSTTQVVCSPICAISLSKKKDKIKADKVWKEEKKILKEKLKKISEYKAEAKYWLQRYIRFRDLGKTCISCEKKLTDIRDYHGGHLFKAELYSGVIFNEINVNGQCVKCNTYLGGNELIYSKNLRDRIGEEKYKALENLAIKTKVYKWSKEELIEIKEMYKKKVKDEFDL